MGLTRAFLGSRLVWTLLGVALLFSLGRMAHRQLARDPRFLALPQEVVISAPAWGGEAVVAPVRERLKALGALNLFDARFLQRIQSAVEEFPGVRAVHDIRRHWPDRYSVEFSLHRPVTVVVHEEREVPVTWEGVVLPLEPYARASQGLLRIRGVDSAPPAPGETWPNDLLADGLAALGQVAPYLSELNRLGLGEIDVSRARNPLQGVRIKGGDGIVVRWGRPRAQVGENPVAQKIGYLREAARYVEQVRGMEIDVRYDAIYVRNPETQ